MSDELPSNLIAWKVIDSLVVPAFSLSDQKVDVRNVFSDIRYAYPTLD